MNNISIKKAAMINFISKYSNVLIQLIINAFLARILSSTDFGIIAVINVFINFFTILADMGIGPAIIQNKELEEEDISNIFKFTNITGVILAVIFIIFSYGISAFYDNNVYLKICRILSLSIFFSVVNIVPNALLLKEKKFKLLGIRTVTINLVAGIIAIILALLNFKYYSLVINSVIVSFLTFLFNYKTSKIKIYKGYNKNSYNKIKNYSSYQFGFSFINYFSRNLDNLLIGRFIGESALGYYDKSYRLMLYPVQNLTNVISPVLHPILSDHQKDKEYIYKKYLSVVKILSVVGLYFGTVCFFISKEIITIFFGNNWSNSIETFKILSISIWPQIITSSSGSIFQATGETRKLLKNGLITTGINVFFIILSLFFKKIEIVGVAVVISYWASFFITYRRLSNEIFNKSFISFLQLFKNHVITAIIIVVIMNLVKIEVNNIWLSLILKSLLGLVGYIIGLIVTKEYKNYLKMKWRK